jgi:hypothetical protein
MPRVLNAGLLLLAACSGSIGDGGGPPRSAETPGVPSASSGGTSTPFTPGGVPIPGAAPGPGVTSAKCQEPPQRIWRLSPPQIRRTFEALLGTKGIDPAFETELGRYVPPLAPFANAASALTATPGFMQKIFEVARDVAKVAVANLPALQSCFATAVTRACVSTFVGDFAARAWRRPVTPDEITDYLTTFDAVTAKANPTTGVEYVLRRMLSAPDMLFRFEVGAPAQAGLFALTPYELASALAYTLTDGPPDSELMAAARDGSLKTAAASEAHARRLMAKSASALGVFAFVRELFAVNGAARPAQAEEVRRFVEQALWTDSAGGKLATLLTAEYSFANAELQKLYGWNKNSTAASFEQVTPPIPEARAGILTRGAVVSTFHSRSARGKFVREILLCMTVPKPPVDVNQDLDAQAAALSKQLGRPPSGDELLARHMADPACSGCHRLIDPIGKPYVAFDDKGVWRAVEAATMRPYDTRAEILETKDLDGPVKDARELGKALAAARSVRACVARQAFQFVAGRELVADDGCRVAEIVASFEQSGGDVKRLFVDLVTSDGFRLRRTP